MTLAEKRLRVPLEQLRWRLDTTSLSFASTRDLAPHEGIIGQNRGVEAFKFGMGMDKKGYNIFVTGQPRSGRLATVKKMLEEFSRAEKEPDDLCYVNNFKRPEEPILLRFRAGQGSAFKKDMQEFLDAVKREAPQLFESEEYIQRKNEIAEAYEKKILSFYKEMENKVEDTGLVVVKMQMGPFTRPDVVPLIDNEPKRLIDLEEMVAKGEFPAEKFEELKNKRQELKDELDHIVRHVRSLQKEVAKKHEEVDKLMFRALAEEYLKPLRETYPEREVQVYLEAVLDDMVEHLDNMKLLGGPPKGAQQQGMMGAMVPPPEFLLYDYQVNLLVDNEGQQTPPVIVESYPTYRNLFGSIERTTDRQGGWRTDFTKIRAGSFVRANGGYLVINLMDAIMEPGVWQTLKRSLKTEVIEIETYDPFYFFSATGLKPEPIAMDVKVVVLGDPYLYRMLQVYDQDMGKIFKVRADYESSMDRDEAAVEQMARFIRTEVDKHELAHFDASGVAAIVEQAVRFAGRQEKVSTAFPLLADLVAEADYFRGREGSEEVAARHVEQAIEARIHRSNQIEDRIQEMIDRGSIFVDTDGEVVGQVNGLAVYDVGEYMFGKPTRITCSIAMGKEGIINIEREAELSGPTHNKGMLILAGYLRRNFAQDRPLSLAASIAFEQSYGGVDGDSASSTELYVLLSALAGAPIRQYVAVTGSVNQKGEIQPIGGVNQKIEGFYLCCKHAGFTGKQGVLIPKANVKDLMLRPEVVEAIGRGKFHVWAVGSVEEGIEVLTGRKAGTRTKKGDYIKGSLFQLVEQRLKSLAEGLRDFGKQGDKNKKDKKDKAKKEDSSEK